MAVAGNPESREVPNGTKLPELGNPLASPVELAYLAGIIDGEGCITIEKNGNRRKNGLGGHSPSIVITNTNASLIEHCVKIIEKAGCIPYVKIQIRNNGWKNCYWITVKGIERVGRMIPIIRPYLFAKQAQLRLIERFIESRKTRGMKTVEYNEDELGIIAQVHQANQRGVTDCMPSAPQGV